MTVIAAFAVAQCPVVFGDLLITGETDRPPTVGIPAIGPVEDFFENSGWAILGLRQKVTIISNHCAVAWAGSYITARVVIDELRQMAREGALTRESIAAHLNGHQEIAARPAAFAGWIFDPQTHRFDQIRIDCKQVSAAAASHVVLAGSGADTVEKILASVEPVGDQPHDPAAAPYLAASCAVSLAGSMLADEMIGAESSNTLLQCFGAGYETALYANGGFLKLPQLTTVVWTCRWNGPQADLAPHMLLTTGYWGDVLLLRSARLGGKSNKPAVIEEQRHAILPMFETPVFTKADVPHISFESKLTCHVVVNRDERNHFWGKTVIQHSPDRARMGMRIDESDDAFNAQFSHDLMERLLRR